MGSSNLPVIFIAFANNKRWRSRYLKNITKEKNAIEKALAKVNGTICELHIETDVSIGKIWEIFQSKKFRDRICIFHFGGHADGFQLMLETWDGEPKVALGEGLISFLANQKNLKLIFLNGCKTGDLVTELTLQGIPAAIGTKKLISDLTAAELAPNFYKGLAEGLPIERAWIEAVYQLNTTKKKVVFGKYNSNIRRGNEWYIKFQKGAERIKYWSLPEASANPLFGLDLPKRYKLNLPNAPYKGLKRFEEEDAGIFFGRGKEIRNLFESIKNPLPVVLFFGQSGVGKSSLLEAGLKPRVKDSYNVIYLRRNPNFGLTNMLFEALEIQTNQNDKHKNSAEGEFSTTEYELKRISFRTNSSKKAKNEDKLLSKWVQERKREKPEFFFERWYELENTDENSKPILLILDQIEETFTKPLNKVSPKEELRGLCIQIIELFKENDSLKGKLVLSFRKEYQSEIENELKSFNIPFSKVFLEPLGKEGIMKAVQGIDSDNYTQSKYSIWFQPDLPEFIALKILNFHNGATFEIDPVGPILQLLLKKMWDHVSNMEIKKFNIDLYNQVGGYDSLRAFLENSFRTIERNLYAKQIIDKNLLIKGFKSGFLLKLLIEFVSEKDTAAQCKLSDLEKKFFSIDKRFFQELIEQIQRTQIIISLIYGNDVILKLMHDSIAPAIRKMYNESNYPIQELSRIFNFHLQNQTLISFNEILFFNQWSDWFGELTKELNLLLIRSQKAHIKSFIKYELRENRIENAINLIHKSSNKKHDKVYFDAWLVNSNLKMIQRRKALGTLSRGSFKKFLGKIEKNIFEISDNLLLLDQNQVTTRIKDFQLVELLESKDFELIIENFEKLLIDCDEKQMIDELSLIRSNYLKVFDEKFLQSEFFYELEINQILLSLTHLCQKFGEKYKINVFEKLYSLKFPKELRQLTYYEKFNINEGVTKNGIQIHLNKIIEAFRKNYDIEKTILQIRDISQYLNFPTNKINELIYDIKLFITKESLGVLDSEENSIEYQRLIQLIFEVLYSIKTDNLNWMKNEESNFNYIVDFSLTKEELLANIKLSSDIHLENFAPILNPNNGVLGLKYLILLIRNNISDLSSESQSTLIDDLLKSWEATTNSVSNPYDYWICSNILLREIIYKKIMNNDNFLPYLASLAYTFYFIKDNFYYKKTCELIKNYNEILVESHRNTQKTNQIVLLMNKISWMTLLLLERLESNLKDNFISLFMKKNNKDWFVVKIDRIKSQKKQNRDTNTLKKDKKIQFPAMDETIKCFTDSIGSKDFSNSDHLMNSFKNKILKIIDDLAYQTAFEDLKNSIQNSTANLIKINIYNLMFNEEIEDLLTYLEKVCEINNIDPPPLNKELKDKLPFAKWENLYDSDATLLENLQKEILAIVDNIVLKKLLIESVIYDKNVKDEIFTKFKSSVEVDEFEEISLEDLLKLLNLVEKIIPKEFTKFRMSILKLKNISKKKALGLISEEEELDIRMGLKMKLAETVFQLSSILDN